MPDIRVVATIPTKPENAESVRPGLSKLAAATRAEEGCISYEVFESTASPGLFVTIETWVGQSDLDSHLHTPHVAEAFATLGDALTGDVAIHPLTPL